MLMEKDKLYFFYDGKTPLGAWMNQVCQTCVKDFDWGKEACDACPFQIGNDDRDCLLTLLNRLYNYKLNSITLQDIKNKITLSEWEFLKSHCNFKDEYNEEDEMKTTEFADVADELTKRQLEDGWTKEEVDKAAFKSPACSKWHLSNPQKDDSYIVVAIYINNRNDKKVKSMYIAEWRDGKWINIADDDFVICWTEAPKMPTISLSVDNQMFTL